MLALGGAHCKDLEGGLGKVMIKCFRMLPNGQYKLAQILEQIKEKFIPGHCLQIGCVTITFPGKKSFGIYAHQKVILGKYHVCEGYTKGIQYCAIFIGDLCLSVTHTIVTYLFVDKHQPAVQF